MCGRYSLALRPSQVRAYLENANMQVYDAPPDEEEHGARQSYNFAPGYNGIVYRADVPDHGAGPRPQAHTEHDETQAEHEVDEDVSNKEVRYKMQTMKWGLIPFWTKRNPDYGSMMKTINCRDDSLIENRGMWNTMKQRKRCIVVAQGFYEWLKNPHSRDKVPHYIKRHDDQLMCMAGLWDCVQYEGAAEKLYTYTIITTDSNKQLKFLHDRMPVVLENGSEELRTWLDPGRHEWSKELQSLLKPYAGELDIYPVSKEVGKVGNNSPAFIIPVDSEENKSNIANFFNNTKGAKGKSGAKASPKKENEEEKPAIKQEEIQEKSAEATDDRKTVDHNGTEDNAPLPVPKDEPKHGIKRKHVDDVTKDEPPMKAVKPSDANTTDEKAVPAKSGRQTRSATSNGTGGPVKAKGSQKITSFFTK